MSTAIITGASRGLGLALARALAAEGWRLVIDARDGVALEHAARELRAVAAEAQPRGALLGVAHSVAATGGDAGDDPRHGSRIGALPGDVTDPVHRRALVAAAGGRLDVLVHNASALGPSPLPALRDLEPNALARIINTNLIAPLALTQLALPHLVRGGRILAITSDAAVEAYPGWGGYGASKAALEQLTAVLGAEEPALRVYAADPGDLRTQMHQDAFPGEDISDRPPPESAVPGLLALLDGTRPSGRYRVADVAGVAA